MAFSSFEHPHANTSTSSEVGPADFGFREQRFRRAFGGDAALLEHVGARGDLERERRVLLDEQNGDAARVDLLDHAEHSEHYRRGETERGLIEQEQARLRHERAPDREHLLLAAGERARRLLEPLAQDGKYPADPFERFGTPRARRAPVAAELEVLAHAQAGEEPPPLGYDGDAFAAESVPRQPREIPAVQAQGAGFYGMQSGDRIDERRLSRAVRPDHARKLARAVSDRHVRDRRRRAMGNPDALDLKHGASRGRRRPRPAPASPLADRLRR